MARWLLDCRPLCRHSWQLGLATEPHELDEVFRLRYDVFFREMGYGNANRANESGRDIDEFDAWCDHLILYDTEQRRLIGAYRAIPGGEAIKRGGFYCAHEFDLSPLDPIASKILQGSRTCVAAGFRTGPAFQYLSYGLELLLRERGYRYFLGAESFRTDNPDTLNRIYSYLRRFAADEHWHVEPTPPSRVHNLQEVPVTNEDERLLPSFVRWDLRMGFKAIGPPAWDPDFRSYDILCLGDHDNLSPFCHAFIQRIERNLPK